MPDQFEQKPPMSSEQIGPSGPEKGQPIKIWGGVTDPAEHDPKNFRYLVHAFNPFAIATQPLATISMKLSGAYKVDKSEGDQSINLFNQPERLGERVSLSMSLIDHEHTDTWGQGGIIVEAPEENITIASPSDFGSPNSDRGLLKKEAQDQLLLSGEQLLQSTSDGDYNEVAAFAKSENGETVRLKGFFIKVDQRGQPIDSFIAEKMRQHARRLNLPLVEIQVKGHYGQEMFEITEDNVWAHYRGNRYNLGSADPRFAFSARDEVDAFFPSSQEIEEVLTHFMKRGDIVERQAQQIREGYKIADTRRKSPKIEYDPKTQEINSVTVKDGYGKNAIEYWLNPSGYCWRVNMEEYIRALRKTFLNPQGSVTNAYEYLRYQTPLSGSEVLSILENRKETMEREEYKRLLSFFNGVKDKIDQVCNQQLSLRRGNRF